MDFNPRTPCGVRRGGWGQHPHPPIISIHAPLAGCDLFVDLFDNSSLISIHAPLAGCDESSLTLDVFWKVFQSTHPLRGATRVPVHRQRGVWISIHAPLAGCDALGGIHQSGAGISIHAPLAGCDTSEGGQFYNGMDFNPRTPCGVRRRPARRCSDRRNFNPRTPCGVRLSFSSTPSMRAQFQSTHPLRGATTRRPSSARRCGFQSTHPLRGATAKTYKENCTFFELADKLSARIAAKKPSAKADRCA